MFFKIYPAGSFKIGILFLACLGNLVCLYLYSDNLLSKNSSTRKNHVQKTRVILHESEKVVSNLIPPKGVVMRRNEGYGLGNQLFFYAESYALSRNLRVPLLLPFPLDSKDSNSNAGNLRNLSNRDFAVNRLILPKGTFIEDEETKTIQNVYGATCEMAKNISRIPEEIADSTKYFGMRQYCFDGEFFKEFEDELKEIRVDLSSPSKGYGNWKDTIEGWEWPVGVHVRRGDLRSQYWNAPIEYFKSAMLRMKREAPTGRKLGFFVFSDEIWWAKEGLRGESSFLNEIDVPVFFVSGSFGGLSNLEEFDLMIKCRSIVISNSTFSWWAAYLMKDGGKEGKGKKVVIRPEFNVTRHRNEVGTRGKKTGYYAIKYPQEWIRIEA